MTGLQHFLTLATICLLITASCRQKEPAPNPWGMTETEGEGADTVAMRLDDIIANGEMIMVTMSGPNTYYEYHGRGMGLHYLLCEKFCQSLGVSLRVDVCKDTLDMIRRVENGEADIIAMPVKNDVDNLLSCGGSASDNRWHWLVNKSNTALADTLDAWLTAAVLKKVDEEQNYWLSAGRVTRHVYSPMLDRQRGVISDYDHLFRRYSSVAQWDWRLLAAQCYQESTFDPMARSWVGAGGLMQIMPGTADELGLPRADIYKPEPNIAAASRYIAMLTRRFSDVANPTERIKFVLASYNGGAHHVRDAMALARKHGASPYRWADVSTFILALSQPAYYNDPVVKYGYMRGSETADYVEKVWARWYDYRGMKSTGHISPRVSVPSAPSGGLNPHPSARRKPKYDI